MISYKKKQREILKKLFIDSQFIKSNLIFKEALQLHILQI